MYSRWYFTRGKGSHLRAFLLNPPHLDHPRASVPEMYSRDILLRLVDLYLIRRSRFMICSMYARLGFFATACLTHCQSIFIAVLAGLVSWRKDWRVVVSCYSRMDDPFIMIVLGDNKPKSEYQYTIFSFIQYNLLVDIIPWFHDDCDHSSCRCIWWLLFGTDSIRISIGT